MFEVILLFAMGAVPLWIVVGLLGLRLRIVPEGQRLVIFRMGRFNRLAGPGPVMLVGRFDTVERTMNVREEMTELLVDAIQFNNVFLGYTFSFWHRTDPESAAGGNRERLVHLSLFSDEERQAQLQAKLREAVMNATARVNKELKPQPASNASIFAPLMLVLPGQPATERLLEAVTEELRPALRSIGVILSQSHPVKIKSIKPNDMLLKNFGRSIDFAVLREQLPDASPDLLAEMLASFQGTELPHTRRVRVEHGDGRERAARAGEEGAARAPKPAPATPSPSTGPDDWRVLKRVPQREGDLPKDRQAA